jgi:hypothetical protein
MSARYPRTYRFSWNNREIPKGTLVRIVAVGKLNSVEVEAIDSGKRYITDRRALRFV